MSKKEEVTVSDTDEFTKSDKEVVSEATNTGYASDEETKTADASNPKMLTYMALGPAHVDVVPGGPIVSLSRGQIFQSSHSPARFVGIAVPHKGEGSGIVDHLFDGAGKKVDPSQVKVTPDKGVVLTPTEQERSAARLNKEDLKKIVPSQEQLDQQAENAKASEDF